MSRRQLSDDDIVHLLEECDLSGPEDILSDSDEEFIPQEDESESEDNVEVNSEESDIASDNSDADSNGDELVAKSGRKWTSSVPPVTRRRKHNIVRRCPGPTRATNFATNMSEVFNMFLDDQIVDTICTFTNAEASRVVHNFNVNASLNRMRIWLDVDPVEIRAFFGVLLIAGALRCRKESISEMWTTDEKIRRAVFTAAMPRDRFVHILQFIRFDDKSTRDQRKANDKLAAIRDVWDSFVENCKKLFEPFEDITIDEQLVAFRGRCPIRQYMKSKPAKYGIKVWAAADVKTSYLYNMQVYTGKLPGNLPEKNLAHRVVRDLTKPFFGSGRGVTTDNFFTSVQTAEFLLQKNVTMTGTLRVKKPDIPVMMETAKYRDLLSSIFIFSEGVAVVSYVPKKNKTVRVLSTQFIDDSVSNESHKKPNMILEYNRTKGGVDNADKLIREYTCARRTSRWPLRLFMNILDIGALNAFIIWMSKNIDWNRGLKNRRYRFLLEIGEELTLPNIHRRANNPNGLHLPVVRAIEAVGVNVTGNATAKCASSTSQQHQIRKRGRCAYCPRNIDRKVNIVCSKCKCFVCETHRKTCTTVTCAKGCSTT